MADIDATKRLYFEVLEYSRQYGSWIQRILAAAAADDTAKFASMCSGSYSSDLMFLMSFRVVRERPRIVRALMLAIHRNDGWRSE